MQTPNVTTLHVSPYLLGLFLSYSATCAAATLPPTSLSATVVGGTVTLKWGKSPSAVTGYNIFRELKGIAPNVPNLTYDDRDRPLGTYRYSVKALGSDGTVSTAVRVDATVTDIVPPGTPTSFTGKSASATTVKLSWNTATDNIGVVGYEIYRDGLPLPQPPVIVGTTISHTDTGLTTGKKYLYKIRAIDATGLKSAWSAEIPVTPVENKTTISLTQFPLVAKVGESVQLTASASDADGDLTLLEICEVTSAGHVCHRLDSGPKAVLQGRLDDVKGTDLVPRTFYARSTDAKGAPSTANHSAAWKAHLYVGNNAGTTSPVFATIQAAVNAATATNYYIAVAGGTYTERVTINKSGITLDGQKVARVIAPDDRADIGVISVVGSAVLSGMVRGFIIGPDTTASEMPYDTIKGYYGILVRGASNVTVKDNVVRLTESSGISVRDARVVSVINNTVEKTNAGSNTFDDTVYINCPDRIAAETDLDGDRIVENRRARDEMISIIGTDGFQVRNNKVFKGDWTINGRCVVGKEGIDAKSGSKNGDITGNEVHDLLKLGIYLDAWEDDMTNIVVDRNKVWNSEYGIALSLENSDTAVLSDVFITNNVLYNNRSHGVHITAFCCRSANGDRHPRGNGPRRDIKIVNNTIYGNGGSGIYFGKKNDPVYGMKYANIDGIVIVNNIVAQNSGAQMNNTTPYGYTIFSRNNLVEGNPGNITGLIPGTPYFVNSASGDFRLMAPSNAINAAINTGFDGSVSYNFKDGTPATLIVRDKVRTDANGAPRLNIRDIGAYQY